MFRFFSEMVVSAVLMLDQDSLPVNMIGFKKVPGGSLTESRLVDGVAFKKTFSYAGKSSYRSSVGSYRHHHQVSNSSLSSSNTPRFFYSIWSWS